MADPQFVLPDFEGLPVIAAGIEIPGAAGGLREAMKIEPRVLHQGDTAYILLETKVAKIRHQPIEPTELAGAQRRVTVHEVIAGTIMDPEVAKPAVDAQKDRILKAKEAEAGIMQLADTNPDGSPAAGMGEPAPSVRDADGFIDPTLIKVALGELSKEELRGMLDACEVVYPKNAGGAKLVDLIVENVPDIAERLGQPA